MEIWSHLPWLYRDILWRWETQMVLKDDLSCLGKSVSYLWPQVCVAVSFPKEVLVQEWEGQIFATTKRGEVSAKAEDGETSCWEQVREYGRTQRLDPITWSTTLTPPIPSPENNKSSTPGLLSQGGSSYICSHRGRWERRWWITTGSNCTEQLQSTEGPLPPAAPAHRPA